MLVRLTPRQRFEILVGQYEPMLRAAFLEAIDDIRSNIVLRRIVERLERGDINGAVKAMNLDDAVFRPLDEAIRQAFNGGGVATIEQMPVLRDPSGYQVVLRWNPRNLVAENWLREHSATLVTGMLADTKVGLRASLADGLARGDNPTRTALNAIGRVNRATGKREGGIIGLTSQQAEQLAEVRRILADPDLIRHYFIRDQATGRWKARYTTTPRRFDPAVLKAINEGRALTVGDISRLSTLHSNRLLEVRGKTIALHETFQSLAAARDNAFRQQIESGKLQAQHVTKTWRHTPQKHPREDHVEMQGQVVQFDQPFIAPDGTQIPYPHAPGVPVNHTLGCKCLAEYKIDFVARLVK